MPRVIWSQPTASGKRTGWAKTVKALVDGTGSKGIVGEYLKDGVETDLSVGQLIVEIYPEGSVKHSQSKAHVLAVQGDGSLKPASDVFDWYKEHLSLRDEIRELLQKEENEDSSNADRYTVHAGRAIYKDGKPYIYLAKSGEGEFVVPTELDELTHIVAALLNSLGDSEIRTTYLGDATLKLRK